MTQYLKKYTPLKYLRGIIESASLFLADEEKRSKWPDKNDIALIDKFIDLNNIEDLGITCMTKGADRHHFWHTADPKEQIVCLWFEENSFLEGATNDESLKKKDIEYKYINTLNSQRQIIQLPDLPFLKRKQYADEREVRIIAEYPKNEHQNTALRFNKASLCRIYFDSKMEREEYCKKRKKYRKILQSNGYDGRIDLWQNKLLRHEGWIEAAFNATK